MRVVKPLRPSEPEGTEGRRSLSLQGVSMYRLLAALWKLRGSLYLSRMRSLKRMI